MNNKQNYLLKIQSFLHQLHVFTLCRVFSRLVLSLVHSWKLLLEATAESYWRFKAYKTHFSTYKETRPREYINKHTQVNLFLKFFVTVKLL